MVEKVKVHSKVFEISSELFEKIPKSSALYHILDPNYPMATPRDQDGNLLLDNPDISESTFEVVLNYLQHRSTSKLFYEKMSEKQLEQVLSAFDYFGIDRPLMRKRVYEIIRNEMELSKRTADELMNSTADAIKVSYAIEQMIIEKCKANQLGFVKFKDAKFTLRIFVRNEKLMVQVELFDSLESKNLDFEVYKPVDYYIAILAHSLLNSVWGLQHSFTTIYQQVRKDFRYEQMFKLDDLNI
ncbi:hypothetical protein HDV06_001970 [Boothiomyces sp. JEL0866]|nr:hypothetical protein HDV06_001970 [Boothiomyces sp. JEL0866]